MKTVSIPDYQKGAASIFIIRATHKGEGWRYMDEGVKMIDHQNPCVIKEACFTVDTGSVDDCNILTVEVSGRDLLMASNSDWYGIWFFIKTFLGADKFNPFLENCEISSDWEEKPKVAKHFCDYLREQDAF